MKTLHAPRPFRKRAVTAKTSIRVDLSSGLKEMIMLAAIRAIQTGDYASSSDHTIRRIRGTSIETLRAIDFQVDQNVVVEINLDNLVAELERASRTVQESLVDQKIAYFIANGTSAAMLQHVFNLTRRRSYELLSETPPPTAPVQRAFGKTRLPGPAERDRIHLTWSKLKGALPDCYIALHQQFPDWSLATLDQVLNEFSR